MAESDRQRLRERALALPLANASDFVKARPPAGVDPTMLRRIEDTTLRTKLVDARLAEGLQSPKGPQRIASIIRVYPDFDAPSKSRNGVPKRIAIATRVAGRLPSVEQMEALLARIRDAEHAAGRELAARVEERIDTLKSSLAHLRDEPLDEAYARLGEALEEKRALRAGIRAEAFRRIDEDADFAERQFLRFLRR